MQSLTARHARRRRAAVVVRRAGCALPARHGARRAVRPRWARHTRRQRAAVAVGLARRARKPVTGVGLVVDTANKKGGVMHNKHARSAGRRCRYARWHIRPARARVARQRRLPATKPFLLAYLVMHSEQNHTLANRVVEGPVSTRRAHGVLRANTAARFGRAGGAPRARRAHAVRCRRARR